MRQHRHLQKNTEKLKRGLAQMLKGGVIMDVVTPEQARLAEASGAVAVMALERVPADIRKQGGVARMSDPKLIRAIMKAVSIPVMAKVRIGHFVEAQILEALGVDYIDESEVLTPADEEFHVDKQKFKIPFVCGARDLGEALRRIAEGASMIRTKGEAGTGNVVEAVRHMKRIVKEINELRITNYELRMTNYKLRSKVKFLRKKANEMRVPLELIEWVAEHGKLPVVNFAAGGIATPSDAALMMQLGAEGVFVGSGIFKSENPQKRAAAIVEAVLHFDNPDIIAKVSEGLGATMESHEISKLEQLYAKRGI